jgi:phage-related protein
MPAIGAGVREIRVQAGGTYRVIYAAKYLISGLMQKGF